MLEGHVFDRSHLPAPIPTCIIEPFGRLQKMIEEMCADATIQETLSGGIVELKVIYAEVLYSQGHAEALDPGLAWKWPSSLSQPFISLLRESHGGALVIFSYFAVLSYAWRDRWYLKGWPGRVVAACSSNVNPAWKKWMAWPDEQVKEGFPIFQFGAADEIGREAAEEEMIRTIKKGKRNYETAANDVPSYIPSVLKN
jgi:hypothetical protein